MRYLILSDIHANLEALDAVLDVAPRDSYDRLLVLGDLVGYGANPNEVVDRIFDLAPDVLIRGNHDKVAAGLEDTEAFNYLAAQAVRWTRETLTPENHDRIAALVAGPVRVDPQIEVCHGTPFDEDVYVFEMEDALQALDAAERPLCLFGHTHIPVAFERDGDRLGIIAPDLDDRLPVAIHPDQRYLVNPGSVGQPRDGDPRAAFATFDSERSEIELRRVVYPIDAAQRKIVDAGLPESLADRLGLGR
ncbi:MAG: metallophosphoesterase family protein [Vicinamibacterales bacterium]|jgi:diadenosine tetraphosphatase ApaH/serine/threonine PP2A family protein phosphatase|nr:metallophosphatase family protein [Acidobacteriota bacterium]MDP6373763.1 metallophosphoesterase family protein [Vicinamibacterales bacterium]MDP6609861.1 metallophosphoesterase family protein [Vicinamibacterales bacterium]HAK55198.1 metallophosphoesterase [Acidobacteriota bacterium]|tara:strand:+ start:2853 stop:3596 length:744 start_codon:yes stop_codon:yes gene_type:complete